MVERANASASPALVRLLVLLVALWSAACVGTETGNPPVAAEGAFRVLGVSAEWVEVVAEAGAVSPGGSEVVILNEGSDQRTTVRSNEDGSLRARVRGMVSDGYIVTVRDDHRESAPVRVLPQPDAVLVPSDAGAAAAEPTRDAGSDAPSGSGMAVSLPPASGPSVALPQVDASATSSAEERPTDAGQAPAPAAPVLPTFPSGPTVIGVDRLDGAEAAASTPAVLSPSGSAPSGSCEELRAQADAARRAAIESAGRACNVDADCADVSTGTRVACVLSCDVVVASASSSSTLESAAERIQTQYCLPYFEQGCPLPDFGDCPVAVLEPRCVASVCVNAPDGSAP